MADRAPQQQDMLRRSVSVCIVDDDEGIRDSLRFLFEEEVGYEVEEVDDGGALLGLLRASPRPRVVLLDRMMIRVDGVATLRLLGDEPALLRDAVIIFMTARHDPLDAQSAELVRDTTYAQITKPFDLDALAAMVEQAAAFLAERATTE